MPPTPNRTESAVQVVPLGHSRQTQKCASVPNPTYDAPLSSWWVGHKEGILQLQSDSQCRYSVAQVNTMRSLTQSRLQRWRSGNRPGSPVADQKPDGASAMPMTNLHARRSGYLGTICLGLVATVNIAVAQSVQMEYQDRGNRYEGVRPAMVSGFDLDLVSALVECQENVGETPDTLRIEFYLPDSSSAHIIVQELDPEFFYRMDKVRPPAPWLPKAHNEFKWPTVDVIAQLTGLNPPEFGAIVRLRNPEPRLVEWVAPAVLCFSRPDTVQTYIFTFVVSADAQVNATVYEEMSQKEVSRLTFLRKRGGRPFAVQWDDAKAAEGWYRIVLSGYLLTTNDPIAKTVYFYHRP